MWRHCLLRNWLSHSVFRTEMLLALGRCCSTGFLQPESAKSDTLHQPELGYIHMVKKTPRPSDSGRGPRINVTRVEGSGTVRMAPRMRSSPGDTGSGSDTS